MSSARISSEGSGTEPLRLSLCPVPLDLVREEDDRRVLCDRHDDVRVGGLARRLVGRVRRTSRSAASILVFLFAGKFQGDFE